MSKEKKNNLTVKIFALVFAVIMWIYVMNEMNPEITKEYKNIPVIYSQLEELDKSELTVMSPQKVNIDVKVSGRRSNISNLKSKNIVAKIDLKGYSKGIKKVPIYVESPDNVEIVNYSPKEVLFEFDDIISKKKPISLRTTGKLKTNYSLGEEKINPDNVILKGPKSIVDSVSQVVTIVDVSDKVKDIETTSPLRLLDKRRNIVKGLKKDPDVVDVYVPIFKNKTVPIRIQTKGVFPSGYEVNNLTINPNTVEIKGQPEDIKNISFIKTVPVNVDSLIESKKLQTNLLLPENIDLVNQKQKFIVELDLEKIVSKTFEFSFNNLNVLNLSPNLSIDEEQTSKTLKVTIKGLESTIENITKEDLSPQIDLLGLDEGTHEVEINVQEIENITVEEIVPTNIKLVLKNKNIEE